MSNKEEETKTSPDQLNQEEDSSEYKESHSKLSPYQLYAVEDDGQEDKADTTELSTNKNRFNGGMGCVSGFIYIILVPYLLSEFLQSFANMWVLAFFEVLGPVLVFLYAKKVKNKALFWGFLIPYFLLLLLYGTCTGGFR